MAKQEQQDSNKRWGDNLDSGPGRVSGMELNGRAQVDTSAPFESVKEAVSRFGGVGYWKPHSHFNSFSPPSKPHDRGTIDIAKVEEEAVQLEKDLIIKEKETFSILKELESTKLLVEKLRLKIQNETSEANAAVDSNVDDDKVYHVVKTEVKECRENISSDNQHPGGVLDLCPSSAPGLILMELKQAKLNLTRTTSDLLGIQSTVESYSKKIEKERNSLEKTRQRLCSSSSKISLLEEDLNHTKQKLHLVKVAEIKGSSENMFDITREIQRLDSETEHYKQIGEAARSEVSRAISEIGLTNERIKTAEIRLIAARKIKEAARASEAVALAEVKALSKSEELTGSDEQNTETVILSYEEYSSLISKAQEAKDICKKKETDSLLLVDQANESESVMMKKVEEATKEAKTSKKVLEEAQNRVEAANRGKLVVEEALRKWRSEHGQKRRSSQNSARFKNSAYRRDSRLLDVNGQSMQNDDLKPLLRQTLSIGQILSRKLLLTEEFENGVQEEYNMGTQQTSLGQMISKTIEDDKKIAPKSDGEGGNKQVAAKKKKFGLARISLLTTKHRRKSKKQTSGARVPMCR